MFVRIGVQWCWAKFKGHRFTALDKPVDTDASFYTADTPTTEPDVVVSDHKSNNGKFF
jgi:hypothetical protein